MKLTSTSCMAWYTIMGKRMMPRLPIPEKMMLDITVPCTSDF